MRQFGILGPLQTAVEGWPVRIDGHKQRALLIALLVHANTVTPTDLLYEWLWSEQPPPPSAAATLQGHISQLRRLLEPNRSPRASSDLIVTRPPGYLLRVQPHQLDALRFRLLVEYGRARYEQDDFDQATRVLADGLALWRGAALADVSQIPAARAAATHWEELRLFATTTRIEADLELGRHQSLIPELESLVAQHPLNERLHGLLILALYRSHRTADAVAGYRRLHETLARELRIRPAPALERLGMAVLNRGPELEKESPRTLL